MDRTVPAGRGVDRSSSAGGARKPACKGREHGHPPSASDRDARDHPGPQRPPSARRPSTKPRGRCLGRALHHEGGHPGRSAPRLRRPLDRDPIGRVAGVHGFGAGAIRFDARLLRLHDRNSPRRVRDRVRGAPGADSVVCRRYRPDPVAPVIWERDAIVGISLDEFDVQYAVRIEFSPPPNRRSGRTGRRGPSAPHHISRPQPRYPRSHYPARPQPAGSSPPVRVARRSRPEARWPRRGAD